MPVVPLPMNGSSTTPRSLPLASIQARGRLKGNVLVWPSVWDLKLDPGVSKGHTSTFPLSLPLACIEASGRERGVVLDPFMGSGTTGMAAVLKGFDYIGFELNKKNVEIAGRRIATASYELTLDL